MIVIHPRSYQKTRGIFKEYIFNSFFIDTYPNLLLLGATKIRHRTLQIPCYGWGPLCYFEEIFLRNRSVRRRPGYLGRGKLRDFLQAVDVPRADALRPLQPRRPHLSHEGMERQRHPFICQRLAKILALWTIT